MQAHGNFPNRYQGNIRRLMDRLQVDEETAMAMLLMTATLMDLYPEDSRVADTVLQNCGGYDEPAYA